MSVMNVLTPYTLCRDFTSILLHFSIFFFLIFSKCWFSHFTISNKMLFIRNKVIIKIESLIIRQIISAFSLLLLIWFCFLFVFFLSISDDKKRPANIINNEKTRKRCEICSKLTIKITKWCDNPFQWRNYTRIITSR